MAVVTLRKDREEILVDDETQREAYDALCADGWQKDGVDGADVGESDAKSVNKKGKKAS